MIAIFDIDLILHSPGGGGIVVTNISSLCKIIISYDTHKLKAKKVLKPHQSSLNDTYKSFTEIVMFSRLLCVLPTSAGNNAIYCWCWVRFTLSGVGRLEPAPVFHRWPVFPQPSSPTILTQWHIHGHSAHALWPSVLYHKPSSLAKQSIGKHNNIDSMCKWARLLINRPGKSFISRLFHSSGVYFRTTSNPTDAFGAYALHSSKRVIWGYHNQPGAYPGEINAFTKSSSSCDKMVAKLPP